MSDSSDLPNRPRFSWDIRTVPWNHGKGNQVYYVYAVRNWGPFRNKLPKTNSNKIPEKLRGIMLHSHFYYRTIDLCKVIIFEVIESEDGVERIGKAIR